MSIRDLARVASFLVQRAPRRNVVSSTQNQAFNALLFYFREVLGNISIRVLGPNSCRPPWVLKRAEGSRIVVLLGSRGLDRAWKVGGGKAKGWHVDYLEPHARPKEIRLALGPKRLE